MDNLRIWNSVSATDPNHTKKVEFGRKFTSIDAHWQIMQATKQFGPVGEGWGYSVEHSIIVLSETMTLAVADVAIWWGTPPDTFEGTPGTHSYGPVRGTCEMWAADKNGKMRVDEDAPKKAMTDALTKGLSHLGFSADVFLGLFDDNRYVQKMKKEFDAAGHAQTQSLEQAHADIAAQTGNSKSTYTLTKERKEIETLKEAAKLAVGMSNSRPELKAWLRENRPTLEEKLSTADFDAFIAMVDERWDALEAAAA